MGVYFIFESAVLEWLTVDILTVQPNIPNQYRLFVYKRRITTQKQREETNKEREAKHDASQMSVHIQSPYPKCLSTSKSLGTYTKCLSTSESLYVSEMSVHIQESVRIRNVCPHPRVCPYPESVHIQIRAQVRIHNSSLFPGLSPALLVPRHDVKPRHARKKEHRLDARETPSPALPPYHAEPTAASTPYPRIHPLSRGQLHTPIPHDTADISDPKKPTPASTPDAATSKCTCDQRRHDSPPRHPP